MHIRVPGDIEAPFSSEIRKKRFRLNLGIYPLLVSAGSVFLLAKAHAIVRVYRLLSSPGPENEGVPFWFFALVFVSVALVVLWWLGVLSRRPLLDEYLYCSRCDALDFDEVGKCPCCGMQLDEKARFLFTFADNEIEVAKRYGLKESKRA
jgi:hypothetical protein